MPDTCTSNQNHAGMLISGPGLIGVMPARDEVSTALKPSAIGPVLHIAKVVPLLLIGVILLALVLLPALFASFVLLLVALTPVFAVAFGILLTESIDVPRS